MGFARLDSHGMVLPRECDPAPPTLEVTSISSSSLHIYVAPTSQTWYNGKSKYLLLWQAELALLLGQV